VVALKINKKKIFNYNCEIFRKFDVWSVLKVRDKIKKVDCLG
jgi:hypothetical protein